MNKIKFLILIFLFCSTLLTPVYALEAAEPVEMNEAEPSEQETDVQESITQDEEMFAPIELDLTDYYKEKEKMVCPFSN